MAIYKLTKEEQDSLEILRNLSGESIDKVSNILKSLLYKMIMDYSEGEKTLIPYFGEFEIIYKGDENTPQGRKATLKADFNPSDFVKLNVGVLEDILKDNGDITKVPIIQEVLKDMNMSLRTIINEENLNEL